MLQMQICLWCFPYTVFGKKIAAVIEAYQTSIAGDNTINKKIVFQCIPRNKGVPLLHSGLQDIVVDFVTQCHTAIFVRRQYGEYGMVGPGEVK